MNLKKILPALMCAGMLFADAAASVQGSTLTKDTTAAYPEQRNREKLVRDTKVIYMNGENGARPSRDSVESLINQFYVDQFRHFQDPQSPCFMFMTKNANLAMGVGGLIRMRGWYDWNGSIPANGFSIYSIPIPMPATRKRHLAATPAGTCLFFTILGRNSFIGNYTGYIECNFDGYQNVGFKLKKAYLTAGDLTMGYATSTFADPAAQPLTIDGAGPNGKVSKTNVLVRYMRTFRERWTVAGSFEFPNSKADTDNKFTATCTDYIPDVALFGQYQWDNTLSHIRLSALMRGIPYRDLLTQTNHTVFGWGIQLSSKFKIIKPLTMYAIATYGRGHSSYTGDLSIMNYDLVADLSDPGRLYAPQSLSLTWGAMYHFLDNLYANVCLAGMWYHPKDKPQTPDYKYGLYGAATLFYDITPRFQVGVEYLAGKRKNFDGTHGNANRVDAMFQFSF